jgi:hypothetical protein
MHDSDAEDTIIKENGQEKTWALTGGPGAKKAGEKSLRLL